MTAKPLGIQERAALLVLMAAAREVSNPELERLAGFSLTGAKRNSLQDRKLIESRKGLRGAYFHTLTEDGWRWCAEELSAEVPKRAGAAAGALYAVLGGLDRYLKRADLQLADVFNTKADVPSTPDEPVTGDVDAEQEIRAAYKRLAKEPRGWVSLLDLRRELDGVTREVVDEALRRMSRARQASLVPESNQRMLSPQQQDASLRIGGEDVHAVSIELP